MSLVRTSLLNGFAVAVKVASAIVLNKVLALYVGPTGYALVGQFQNAVTVVVNLTGGLVSAGVTKITAEHFDNEVRQHAVWKTAICFSLCASLIAAIGIFLFRDMLSAWLLSRSDMSNVLVFLALALPATAINTLLLAIINGKKAVGIYVSANIIGSVIVMIMTGLLAYNFGLYGALIAFAINPALGMVVTWLFASRAQWLKIKFLFGRVDPHARRELAGFGLMGLTTALSAPITYILIRDCITSKLGLEFAGYWQASWKISEIYLMLITTTLTVYYLPRLSEIRSGHDLKSEIFKVYKFVMPIVLASAISIYLLRDFIIGILFSPEFMPMRELFAWQLIGDVIKIGSFVLAYIMLGRAMVKIYIFSEIFFNATFFVFTFFLVDMWGLRGVAIAYAANYSLYWAFMVIFIRREITKMPDLSGTVVQS